MANPVKLNTMCRSLEARPLFGVVISAGLIMTTFALYLDCAARTSLLLTLNPISLTRFPRKIITYPQVAIPTYGPESLSLVALNGRSADVCKAERFIISLPFTGSCGNGVQFN